MQLKMLLSSVNIYIYISDTTEKLKRMDLWVAGVSEKHVEGGQVNLQSVHLLSAIEMS